MDYNKIIINRISALCRERGISYNKLAAMCGLHQSTIDNIVRGVSQNPRIITLHKIAYAFSMTLSEFLDFPDMNEYSFEDASDINQD